MCGILVAIDLEGSFSPPDYDRFVNLTDIVSYRGPDAAGYLRLRSKPSITGSEKWDVFLGHRRLSIIDLSEAGNQPMSDGHGRWLIFNGEIFNFVELRDELEQAGELFETATDTEVILRIYARYGLEGFSKLNGMWAFALLDLPARRVILSRDRFSIKPLYYTRQGSRLYFASEIKQLLPLLPSKQINRNAMMAFLAQLLLDNTTATFIEGVSKIPSKTSAIVSLDTGTMEFHQYWDYKPESVLDFDRACERFAELLADSVRIRLRSDVKLGCLLSGGLDSSTIAGICHQMGSDVETFSVVSDDQRYSEQKFIDVVTSRTGVRNHKLWFRSPCSLELLKTVLAHNDEPVAGFSVLAQYSIFRMIKQETDVTVLLSGQGGDEVLLGYLKFFFLHLRSLLQHGKVITVAKELLASLLQGTIIRQFRLPEAKRYVSWMNRRPYDGALCLGKDYIPAPIGEIHDPQARQVADIDFYSVPALAHYEDRNSMAHGLEVRHPFLDHRLVNFLIGLPTDYKIRNGWTKYILRKSSLDLPAPIRWRKDKQGFLTAEEMWFRGDLQPVVRAMFRDSRLQELGFLNQELFLNYYERFLAGHSCFLDICRAFIAEVWSRMFLSDETPAARSTPAGKRMPIAQLV